MVHRRPLFPVLLTYFLDTFGLAIVYPIFTPLILSPTEGLLSASVPMFERTILLGFLVAAFPFAQFFGAPFLGELSDKRGRKKVLTYSILGSAIGYAISGWGILATDLLLLFIGRLWTGLFAGNLTICLASVADMSHNEHDRAKNFGLIGACGGFSFIIAIMIGELLNTLSPSIPFWVTAVLALLNMLCVVLFFNETREVAVKEKINFMQGMHDLKRAFRLEGVRRVYLVYFFYMTAWSAAMQFLPTMLIEHLHVSEDGLSFILVWIGIAWSVMNLGVNRVLAWKYSPPQTLKGSMWLLALFLFSTLFTDSLPFFLTLFFAASCFGSLCWTNSIATVSLSAPHSIQGSILGLNQSMGSIAVMLGPTLGGILAGINPHLVFFFAAVCSIAGGILLAQRKKNA